MVRSKNNYNSLQLDRHILEVLFNQNEPIDIKTMASEGGLKNGSVYKAMKRLEHLFVVKKEMSGKWVKKYQISQALRNSRDYCLKNYNFDILDVICKNSEYH